MMMVAVLNCCALFDTQKALLLSASTLWRHDRGLYGLSCIQHHIWCWLPMQCPMQSQGYFRLNILPHLSQIKADPSLPSHCCQIMLSFCIVCEGKNVNVYTFFWRTNIDRPLSSSRMIFSLSTHNDDRLSMAFLSVFKCLKYTAQQIPLQHWTRLVRALQVHWWANTSQWLL